MGNCLSSCLPACKSSGNFGLLAKSGGDFSALVGEMDATVDGERKRHFVSRLFQRKKDRKTKQAAGVVALLKPQLSYRRLPELHRASSQSRDIHLQCLDARALLSSASLSTRASTPENSLDLEWEHEALPCSMIHEASGSSWATSIFPEETLTTQPNFSPLHTVNVTDSDCSRVSSSANSLEWDSVQNSVHSDVLDTDTQFLLHEIDRLTVQALKETGIIRDDVSNLDNSLQ